MIKLAKLFSHFFLYFSLNDHENMKQIINVVFFSLPIIFDDRR